MRASFGVSVAWLFSVARLRCQRFRKLLTRLALFRLCLVFLAPFIPYAVSEVYFFASAAGREGCGRGGSLPYSTVALPAGLLSWLPLWPLFCCGKRVYPASSFPAEVIEFSGRALPYATRPESTGRLRALCVRACVRAYVRAYWCECASYFSFPWNVSLRRVCFLLFL